jgi:hypothetical protein
VCGSNELRPALSHAMKLLIVLPICLAACSTQPPLTVSRCPICVVNGELTLGLVQISAELERDLMSQLPLADRNEPYCWYQTPTGTLEAQFAPLEIGYEFERRDGAWLVSRRIEYLQVREAFP